MRITVYSQPRNERRTTGAPNSIDTIGRNYVAQDMNLEDRIRYVGWDVIDAGCWEWSGGRDSNGYGLLRVRNETLRLHRLAYETWVGPIPEGHVVRHKCDNPPCINPEHLETGTQGDNVRDAVTRGRHRHGDGAPGVFRPTRRRVSDEDVAMIRERRQRGEPVEFIARDFGISKSYVYGLTNGWSHRIE